ncbi:unnamed protein product [Allacma fusca]|uniref:CUB domain-containing protein n=1 Tax=Allacma fusca TaxID=39272 RepID=A0A8J2K326_9HEXA|nr:unnamed protein product [Allacma fusca]
MNSQELFWKAINLVTIVTLMLNFYHSPVLGYYFEESYEDIDEARDYLPCGSLIYLEVDKKYYIHNEGYGYQDYRYRRSPGHIYAGHYSSKTNRRWNTNRQSNCVWRFESNGKCRLMAYFDHYYPGDRRCTSQYIFLTDDDTEIQACSTRGLPRAFEASTNKIKVKHYRKRNVHQSEFTGYVICHSHEAEYEDDATEEYMEEEYYEGPPSKYEPNRQYAYEYPEGTYDDTYDDDEIPSEAYPPEFYKSRHYPPISVYSEGGSYAAIYGSNSQPRSFSHHARYQPALIPPEGYRREQVHSTYPNQYNQPLPLATFYVQSNPSEYTSNIGSHNPNKPVTSNHYLSRDGPGSFIATGPPEADPEDSPEVVEADDSFSGRSSKSEYFAEQHDFFDDYF